MKSVRWFCAVALTATLAAPPAQAQEFPKPGPEHADMKKREGNWETTMKFGDMEIKGTVTFKMELGGMWLVGNLETELFGQKFQGKSIDSYDPVKKKFVSVWVDSMSTSPMVMEGTYDKAKKTMTMEGEGPGQDGKPTKHKSVVVMTDDNNFVMTMYMGDAKEPAFVVSYKRKK